MKTLGIVGTAYRGTLEEQDDTVLWFSHTIRSVGAEVDLLLEGNATNYAVHGQDASGLAFGAEVQTRPPRIADDVRRLVAAGVTVYVLGDDAADRGIDRIDIIDGIEWIGRAQIPELFGRYGRIWHW